MTSRRSSCAVDSSEGLKNLFDLYRDAVDSWQIYDNSAVTGPQLIAESVAGEAVHILNEVAWTNLQEKLR